MNRTAMQTAVVMIEDIPINYYILGQGKPLIFLHGAGIGVKEYEPILQVLAKKYKVFAPDLPGFGNSGYSKKIKNLDCYVDIIAKFLDFLEKDSYLVVGHSFGGAIAQYLAIKTNLVNKLYLIDTAGVPLNYKKSDLRYRFFFLKSIHNFLNNPQKSVQIGKAFFKNIVNIRNYIPALGSLVYDAIYNNISYKKIMIPVTLIRGKNDEIFSLQAAHLLSKKIPNSQIIEREGNHDWCLFDPNYIGKIIS